MKKVICVLLVLFTAFLCGCEMLFYMVTMFAYDSNLEEPLPPKITYGEFDFEVTYQVNDEIITVKDTYICEYEGVEKSNEIGAGYYRKWSERTKSGNDFITIYSSETDGETFEIRYLPICRAEYLMGDPRRSKESYEKEMNRIDRALYCMKNGVSTDSITSEMAWEQYHVRVVELKFAQPIENEFGEEWA